MNAIDPSRTERMAILEGEIDLFAFARRSLAWAQAHEHTTITWYLATIDSTRHLERQPRLRVVSVETPQQ